MNMLLKGWRPYLLLLIIACIVYWPLTLGIFSLKNDALIYFLPWRYHISESIQAGHFPFWSPYLYTGLPLHSDIQSGTWNPVVLLISLFTRYDMQVLQWELLLYVFIAGAGMYKLIRETGYTSRTALIAGVTYMCCGFMTDSGSFIPWITSAAYLPFVLLYFYRSLKKPSFITALKLGVFLFLLLTAGYPSFFIYAGYILLVGFIAWLVRCIRNKTSFLPVLKYLAIGIVLSGLLSSPAIISYTEFFPYYQRGVTTSLGEALTNPFPPFSSISYLLPTAVVKPHEWIPTDLAMRNAYTGIFILLFCGITLTRRLNYLQKIVVGVSLFSFLFSLGDYTPLRKWCYDMLPLMDSFRHPGIIRLFTTIGIILLSAKAIDEYFSGTIDFKKVKIASASLAFLIIGFVIYYLINGGANITVTGSFKQKLDSLSFASLAVITGVMQLIFLALFFFLYQKQNLIRWILKLNIIVFAWIALPFTFVSQTKTKEVDRYLNTFPRGFPPPDSNAINAAVYHNKAEDSLYGYPAFYNKKIAIQDNGISPTINKDYISFLADTALRQHLDKYPLAYVILEGAAADSIIPVKVKGGPSEFWFDAKFPVDADLYFFQQYHPNWHAWTDKNNARIEKANLAFMKIRLPANTSSVRFWFAPGLYLSASMFLSVVLIICIILYLAWRYWQKKQ